MASHPRRDRRDALAERHGIRPVAANREALAGAEVVVLAVKPQMLARVMRELRGGLTADQVVVIDRRRRHDPDPGRRPPARRRRPRDAEHAEPDPAGDQRLVAPRRPAPRGSATWRAAVLRALGDEREVADEAFVAMATALSGTGPTYLFSVMEALIDAGVHLGFPRELAHDLVVETLIGSAEFAAALRASSGPAAQRRHVARRDERGGDLRAREGSHPHRPLRRGLGGLSPHPRARRAAGGGGRARLMYAVIMAGGSGTRLWPLSRRGTPKQLLALTGDTSLLQQTVARLDPLLRPHDIYVITSQAHVRATQDQLPQLPPDNVLGEPLARSTAVAAALATALARRESDEVGDRPAGRPLRRRRRARSSRRCARPRGSPSAGTS